MAPFGAGVGAGGTALTSTTVATSVSFAVNLQAVVPGHSTIHLLVQGQMNFEHHTVVATIPMPVASPPISNAALVPGTSPLNLHTEWVDDHAYMTVPSAWSGLARGAQTLSLPASSSLHRSIDTVLAQSAVALTYAKILLSELTEHQKVRPLGKRTLDGVSVTGTEATVTLGQLFKLVPELSPTMAKDVSAMANQTIPISVWFDRQGRLVDVQMAADKASAGTQSAPAVTGTVRFSDYDAPDKVTVPPPGTVKPIPPVLRQLLKGLYYF
jgi:hypothetical protein